MCAMVAAEIYWDPMVHVRIQTTGLLSRTPDYSFVLVFFNFNVVFFVRYVQLNCMTTCHF